MDLPVTEIMKHAQDTIDEFSTKGTHVEVRFKATCPACGQRTMLQETNIWREHWECAFCGVAFTPTGGGYALFVYLGSGDPNPVKKEVMRILKGDPPT